MDCIPRNEYRCLFLNGMFQSINGYNTLSFYNIVQFRLSMVMCFEFVTGQDFGYARSQGFTRGPLRAE